MEILKAMEECTFAAEVGRRGGRNGLSNRCGRRGLVVRVPAMVKDSADQDFGVRDDSRDAYSHECLETGEGRALSVRWGERGNRMTFT